MCTRPPPRTPFYFLRPVQHELRARSPAGADWLLRHPELKEHKFTITTASGIHAIQITEHIIATLLAFARRLPQALKPQSEKRWLAARGEELFQLYGKRLPLIGVGAIGTRTAEIATALGMSVTGVRRDASKSEPHEKSMHGVSELHDLLPDADFIVITAPLTEHNRGMIGEEEFKLMKRNAYLVNIGRGGTIDEAAIVNALQTGQISGAALDVFGTEPLPPESPLWEMENVIITVHFSGATPEYNRRAVEVLAANLELYGQGRRLNNVWPQ